MVRCIRPSSHNNIMMQYNMTHHTCICTIHRHVLCIRIESISIKFLMHMWFNVILLTRPMSIMLQHFLYNMYINISVVVYIHVIVKALLIVPLYLYFAEALPQQNKWHSDHEGCFVSSIIVCYHEKWGSKSGCNGNILYKVIIV